MKKITFIFIAAAMALVICVLSGFTEFSDECEVVRENTIRLRIVANSDSDFDQDLKLQIRDALTEQFQDVFAGAESKAEAAAAAQKALDDFEDTANHILKKSGVDYSASAELTDRYFDTTDYGEFMLPAGTYTTVQLTLGEGKGKNWFCIAFPPLCISASSDQEAQLEAYLDQNGWKFASKKSGYVLKFKLVELIEKWRKKAG
ncbi:MAG TPA: stage II sporulation protein R [Oscillospiraceae bacterium]|nr:stage II sporulation protein R [Oscillospiraceae bacterium]HPF55883.1 stage II sporulation protein R [Clostridiales bacterium]HPK35180.1 stage II sporulation protein R [Oscillospiraceae bacterium]HPR74983.1 stage II sporulation protein R [Oscillospiraceae bacterium]